MDLHSAVTISMLALSRIRVCTAFRELRHQDPSTTAAQLLQVLGVADGDHSRVRQHLFQLLLQSARRAGDSGGSKRKATVAAPAPATIARAEL